MHENLGKGYWTMDSNWNSMHCNLVCVFVRCRSGHQWTSDDDENDEMARCRCEAYVGNTLQKDALWEKRLAADLLLTSW